MSVPTLSAADYGVKADGKTDDTASWNSAISALRAAGGGVLLAPVGISVISGTLALNFDGAKIVGMGRGAYHDVAPTSGPVGPQVGPAASTLVWNGPSSGTMVSVAPAPGSTSGITDWAVTGVHLDSGYFQFGTSAATGLLISSASHGEADVFCDEFNTQGLLMTTTSGLKESSNSSYNRISFRGRQINQAGVLCRITGGDGQTNSCFNRIPRIAGEFSGSIGLDLHDCDNNTFEEVYLQPTGTGQSAVVFNGKNSSAPQLPARNNTIEHLSTSVEKAQILAIGTDSSGVTSPSGPNRVQQFDESNVAPDFVIGEGALLYWGTNTVPPGLQAFSGQGQYGGYRTTEDGFSIVWGSVGPLSAGSTNQISFPNGLFKKYVVGATATPLGGTANSYAINNTSTSGMEIVVGPNAAYFTWRAEGF